MTSGTQLAANDLWQSTNATPYCVTMLLTIIFLLGIANFALHKAVIESRHPLLGQIPLYGHASGEKVALAVEFAVLLAAMLLVWSGNMGWAWLYVAYSLLNGGAAWLILTGKM